jgi:SPP1 gp7 family putative phage head morphogenesis protein
MPRRLTDIAVRYQVFLERLKAHEVQDFGKVFDKITKATAAIVDALEQDIGKATRKELTSLLSELRVENKRLLDEATSDLFGKLEKLAGDSASFEAQSINSLSDRLKLVTPTAEAAYRAVLAQPVSATGQLLEGFVGDWTKGEVTRLNNAVQRAWGEGWTNQQLKAVIRGSKASNYKDGIIATSRRNAEAVLRTSIQHVASTARTATWEANSDLVIGYRWVSTLDGRTTQVCKSLDGNEFYNKDGGRKPRPPIHINCRSTTVAILDPKLDLGFLDKGATRASMDGPVPAGQSYYDWLKGQPAEFQKEALGATRAKLFADGGLSAEKFAELNLGRNFQPLTLDEMRNIAPLAFAKAGIPPKP